MKKNEIIELIKDIADDGDINETLLNQDEFKGLKDLSKLNADDITEILAGEVGKTYMTSHDDSVRSTAVETYKNGKGKEAIEKARKEGIEEGKTGKKKTPEMEMIEKQAKEIEELKAKDARNAANSAIGKILEDKKLPSELVNFVYGDGKEETYKNNIDTIEKIINGAVDSGVKAKLGANSYTPPTDAQTNALNAQIAGAMGVQ